jgi:predicted transcriptional regulator
MGRQQAIPHDFVKESAVCNSSRNANTSLIYQKMGVLATAWRLINESVIDKAVVFIRNVRVIYQFVPGLSMSLLAAQL